MGLFGVRIGLGGGENEVDDEMRFVSFSVIGDGNGRIITEDGDSIGEMVVVNVVVVEKNPANRVLDLIGGNCDGDGLGRRDALVDCGEQG